ncbi:androgen-dependent TFPI-regulating protein-like [Epargyreus clarus]|uniref:androgen-dependent TFPI-regulating protein-like n=1 Tax=Epargyreus clarus TaxID=520877 RepID=UPI003C2E854B
MVEKIHCRAFGYCFTLILNFINMLLLIKAVMTPMSPELETIFFMKSKYITVWNLVIQCIYAVIGLICDGPVILKIEEKGFNKILDYLRWYRSVFYSGLVWPCGLFIFTAFWPFFLYDRDLVFPASIDTVLSPVSNHIMHSVILPIMLWEFVFAERRVGKPDKLTKLHVIMLLIAYNSVIIVSYIKTGVWPYPMLRMSYGTIYFPLIFVYFVILSILSYYAQWYIADVFKLNEKPTRKVK